MDDKAVWLLRYRVPVLVFLALVTAALATQLPRLRFDFSPQQLFETGEKDEVWRFFEQTIEWFGRDDGTLFVVLDAGEGGDTLTREHLDWLTALCEHFESADDVLRTTSIATAVSVRKNEEGDLDVMVVGELPREELLADPLLVGSLVSADARLALALIDFKEDRRKIDDLTESVGSVRTWLAHNPPPQGSTASLIGIPFIRVDAVQTIRNDQTRFVPITGGIIALFLFLGFRRISRTVFALFTVFLAIVWSLSIMAIADIPVDIINSVLPSLLLVIGVSDGLHLMVRDQEEHRAGATRSEALSIAVRSLAVACFLTSFTTAAGFASLAASSTMILVRFGLIIAAGVLIAYVLTLGVLPQLLSFAPPPSSRGNSGQYFGRFALWCGHLGLRRPRTTVAIGLLAAAGLAAVGFLRVDVNVRLTELYKSDHPVPTLQRLVDEHLGGVLPFNIVVSLPQPGGHRDPDILARLAKLQDRIDEYAGVASTRSVVDLVKALHRTLSEEGSGALPTTRDLLAQEWLFAEMGSEELPIDRFVAEDGKHLRILLRAKDVGGKHALGLSEEIERLGEEIFGDIEGASIGISGDAYIASKNLTTLIRDLFTSLTLASVVIFLVLLITFRSLRIALVGIVPNALPLLAILGFMGIVGMDLDVTNVVIFSIALGLAVDDTIHMLSRFREEQAMGGATREVIERTLRGTGQAIVLTTVVLGSGMVTLMFSDFVATARFGGLTALTLGVALLADLIFLPALLLLVYRGRSQ